MPLPLLIGAGISALTGIISAKKQATASREAAAIQAAESRRQAGLVTDATNTAVTGINAAGEEASKGVLSASEAAALGITDASTAAAGDVNAARDEANLTLKGIYDQQLAATEPYQQAGTRALTGLEAGANEEFAFSEDDPSYQWRLRQGQQALERSAAARGGLQSGGTLKAVTRYAQGAASTEYQAAFDRFQRSRETRLRTLTDLAGLGMSATGQAIAAGTNYGNAYSNNVTDAARTAGEFTVGGAGDAGRFRTAGAEAAGRFTTGAAADAGRLSLAGVEMSSDIALGGANAQAAGKIGGANAWRNGLTAVENAANTVAANWPEKTKP